MAIEREIKGVKSPQGDSTEQSVQALGFHNSSALDDGRGCGLFGYFAIAGTADLESGALASQYFERHNLFLSLPSPCQVY